MSITKFISDDARCIRTLFGENESWEIKIANHVLNTEYAGYTSINNYKKRKKEFIKYLGEVKRDFTENDVSDFIDDMRSEGFKEKGGYVVFFLKLHEAYSLRHTGVVKEIEVVD